MKFTAAGTVPDSHRIPLLHVPENKKEEKPCSFSSLVAGVGIEPHDLRVMSPTSYQLLYPAILDCKYTDYF